MLRFIPPSPSGALLVHERFQHMYSLVVRSTFSLIRCTHTHSLTTHTHTHIHLHTLTTLTHTGSDHLTLLTEHGDIYTLGCAEQGQLGRVPECFSSRGGRKGTSLLLRPDIVRFRVKKGAGKLGRFLRSLPHLCGHTERGGVCMGIEQLWTTVHWRQ